MMVAFDELRALTARLCRMVIECLRWKSLKKDFRVFIDSHVKIPQKILEEKTSRKWKKLLRDLRESKTNRF